MMKGASRDDRAVSEAAGVAALLLLTVLVTASVGMNVLLVDEDEGSGIQADFEFRYFSNQESLLVTYNEGPELVAGNITVSAPAAELSWADLGNANATDTITPGARVQLRQSNAYGRDLRPGDNITLLYTTGTNRTVLETYEVGSTGGS